MSTNPLNRDALVVGICQYDDLPMSQQLDTLAKQAEQLAQLLETQGGFKVTRLPCAADLTLDLKKRVTLPELKQAIEKLLYPPAESPTQTALLFFAGHGLVEKTRLGTEGFLATSEANNQSIYGFSLKTLRELLRHSPVKQQIIFLEACHSGAFFTDIQVDKERDYCFVTSARANEEALAVGLLTNALLEILDYTHQSKDTPWVNSDTLIENLRQKLTTTEGWQRFEVQTQGHLILTNRAFSQELDPNAKPYKGLHYFDNKPEDAQFFKGRENLIAELLTKVKEKPFLAILGASGNGKSSVVRAGVLYQLQQTEPWQIVNPFTPTADPLTALTNGLGKTEVLTFVQASAKARVLLTIDQFEEVFSLCQDSQARETFFNALLDAVEQATGKFCLIVVMRADFMDKCSHYPRLARYFQDHQHIVTPPTEAEIQQIIEAPAKQAGFLVEPRLVAEMVTDFKDSLGGLPLLEFALTTLWEKGKADRLLRYADYQALGRIQGILEKKATETYEELTPTEQIVAKRVFLELTELGEGKSDTRRLVPQTDLLGFTTTQTSVEQVIAKLVKEHLIVTDKTTVTVVNIAHDALIEHWSVLRQWLKTSRKDIEIQRQIDKEAKAWNIGKKALLVEGDLAVAERYLATHLERVPLSEVGVEFVKASVQVQRLQRRWKQAGIASLIATTLGLAGYTYWYQYSYVWEHETYCNQFVKRYGLPQCVRELTTNQVQGRAVSYRLLRKGSKNPVYKVQAVRSKSKSPSQRFYGSKSLENSNELTTGHDVETYFGETYSSKFSSTKENQWEFVLDTEGKIVYEKAYDTKGKLVWGLVYSPNLKEQPTLAHYVGPDGFPRPPRNVPSEFIEFEYDANGNEKTLRYFDRQHHPQPGLYGIYRPGERGVGVFKIEKRFDKHGNVTELAYFNVADKPTTSYPIGCHKDMKKYDDLGNMIEETCFDTANRPTLYLFSNYHKLLLKYDKCGKAIEFAFFDVADRPTFAHLLPGEEDYHKRKARYDDRGNQIEIAYFDIANQPMLYEKSYHKLIKKFDDHDNVVEEAYFNVANQPTLNEYGYHQLTKKFHDHDKVVEEAYFDVANQPILNKDGYHQLTKKFDEHDQVIEESYFDVAKQPTLNKDGYHQLTKKFDDHDKVIEEAYFNAAKQPMLNKEGYHKLTKKYDDKQGKVIEEAYFNAANQPMLQKDGYHKFTVKYDDRGNEIENAYFDVANQPILYKNGYLKGYWQANYHKLTQKFDFDERGKVVEVAFFDPFGNLTEIRDGSNHVFMRAFFNTRGQPMFNQELNGYKLTQKFDGGGQLIERTIFRNLGKLIIKYSNGNVLEQLFFDTRGQPMLDKDLRVHKLTFKYDEHGREIESAFFGMALQPMLNKWGFHKSTKKYDEHGKMIEWALFDTFGNLTETRDGNDRVLTKAFFDTRGEPTLDRTWGFHKHTRKYDEHSKVIELAFFPTFVNDDIHKITFEYDTQGKEVNRKYFDVNGRPIQAEVVVVSIVPNSQAEQLGIQTGDIFTYYDGKPIMNYVLFTTNHDSEPADGPPKKLTVLRKGKKRTFKVKPGKIGVELNDQY